MIRANIKSVVPGIDIAHDSVDPVSRRAMRAGNQARPQRLFGFDRPPHLSSGHEEALVAGEAVQHRRFAAMMVGKIKLIGMMSDRQPSEIADILTQ